MILLDRITEIDIFNKNVSDHFELLKKIETIRESVIEAGERISETLLAGGRVFFCGNGGSAADAQHLAAELSGRYLKDRRPLDGIALNCNVSAITAIGNDYSFDEVFARQVRAHGRLGDVLVAISTSGCSKNILLAAAAAKENGMFVIGMTGIGGGELASLCDTIIKAPSSFTPRIQEMHIMAGHIICEIIDMHIAELNGAEI